MYRRLECRGVFVDRALNDRMRGVEVLVCQPVTHTDDALDNILYINL